MLDACNRAKIKPAVSFHVLRHTHGSTLAMRGVPMGVIAEQPPRSRLEKRRRYPAGQQDGA
jgi:integrase